MKRIAVLLLVACGRAPVASVPDVIVAPPAISDAAREPEAAAEADAGAQPVACSDAGPPAWYVVASGDKLKCMSESSMLEWIEDGAPRVVSWASTDFPLIHRFAFIAEMPSCFGANAEVSEVRKVRENAPNVTYHVKIEGHDNGGHGCHAYYQTTFEGDIVVDEMGALVRGDFKGTELVSADNRVDCQKIAGVTRSSVRLRRSCSP